MTRLDELKDEGMVNDGTYLAMCDGLKLLRRQQPAARERAGRDTEVYLVIETQEDEEDEEDDE